jgi:hypothetical protein
VGHRLDGFGTQVFTFNNNQKIDLLGKLEQLNIRYVRLTRQGTWEQMRSLRELTDRLSIEWVYTVWSAPGELSDEKGMLEDLPGFTRWWVEQVEALTREGMKPRYVELMNEPDSMGHWSTGIAPEAYNSVVKAIRKALDERGFLDIGIVGPGLAHLDWGQHNTTWIEALDVHGIESLAAWSTHSWDDGDLCRGGASCIERQSRPFQSVTRGQDGRKPVFVTEYGSKETEYQGGRYPNPASTVWCADADHGRRYYSVTNTVAYAVRLYENSLALLNSGANVPFVWQLADEVSELNELGKSWGLIDIEGRPKPAFVALTTLCPTLPIGARVVRAPDQSSNRLYASVFVHEDDIVVAISNDVNVSRTSTIRLRNVAGRLEVGNAVAFEMERRGDPATMEPDIGRIVERRLPPVIRDGGGDHLFHVSLPASSTLTVVLRRSPSI